MKNIFFISIILILSSCKASYVRTMAQNVSADNLQGEIFPGTAIQRYVSGTEDLPIYNGFKAIKGSHIAYDSVSGRILDASFHSKGAEVEDVRKFYDLTLPELGWKKKQYQIYHRDGEELKVNILKKPKGILLKFSIRPVNRVS